MSKNHWIASAMLLSAAMPGCADLSGVEPTGPSTEDELGSATLALSKAPEDAGCLRVRIENSVRSMTRLLDLSPGQSTLFRMEGLPVGLVTFKGEAFHSACNGVFSNSIPTWYSEPVQARIQVVHVAHVVLEMIRNGRGAIVVDFDETNNPVTESPAEELDGVTSSESAYLVPSADGVEVRALLTVGDAAGLKPDGTPYRMVGLPDGMGAYDNGDGTFTLLSNHELDASQGIARAHGGTGAFVSKWRVRKSDLAVLEGQDLTTQYVTWNPLLGAYNPPATGLSVGRFCSADLAEPGAYYNPVTGLGTEERLFLNGEETGSNGRAFAHAMDGTSYELPRLGKGSWENQVAHPGAGDRTVVVGLDDSSNGKVYVYAGDKTNTGSVIERAGLTNGSLYVVVVPGVLSEPNAGGIPAGRFEMAELGNVENYTGAQIAQANAALSATGFQRPEDGAWDPGNPNDFYFVTTASFNSNSRLWRLRFDDPAHPELGGSIEMVLDGSEGHRMLDNITIDKRGHILLTEDVGGNDHLGRVYRYTIATDELTVVATHDPERFLPGAANFLTRDEEASGIIDVSDILGDGWFLVNTQAHFGLAGELAQGGQFMALYDPGTL